ncbi:PEP-CTERM sorting domain-containing protein [Gloeothece verrucosa]|uniref:PEP-CTERM protein-sorting domain-containing protein n=1 Tax=Gloeothece verrucosa (strain PCC 7822) TaxID=497965 RepID=E0UG48_GLOV7|nr:PEP-CTERM sorting domain-containing protein [Gloeothece verrucosa]ADN15549.1 hypothetical protein Cyan7822_3608 [Gloeothece verrucosa PCC 7822]
MSLKQVISLSLGTIIVIGSSLFATSAKAVTFYFSFNLNPYPDDFTSLTGKFSTSGTINEGLANAVSLDSLPDWSFAFTYQGPAGEQTLRASKSNFEKGEGDLMERDGISLYIDGGNLLFDAPPEREVITFFNGGNFVQFQEHTTELSQLIYIYNNTSASQNSGAFYTATSVVPEPLTLLGVGAALGFGSFFKHKLAKK